MAERIKKIQSKKILQTVDRAKYTKNVKNEESAMSTYKKSIFRKEFDHEGFLNRFKQTSPSKPPDFVTYQKQRVIGKGAFGSVILYRHKKSGQYIACKRLEKDHLIKHKMVDQLLMEKKILHASDCSFVIKLFDSWKDNNCVYLLMPFVNGGDMLSFLTAQRKLTEPVCRFYSAQLALALEYLHAMNVIHRDIKPENVLIDPQGYIKLADFGMAKVTSEPLWTFCGTMEYMSPEMIHSKGYGKSTDWWSFGVFIYEMVVGKTPFYAFRLDQTVLFGKILHGEFDIPKSLSSELRNLLSNFLMIDVNRRLGCTPNNDVVEVKQHKWYRDINWQAIEQHTAKAPAKPSVKEAGDTSNFNFFTETKIRNGGSSTCQYENEFDEF